MSRKKPVSPRYKVTVEVAGEKHVLRSDVPPEYTRAVADYLDGVVRSLPGAGLEPHRALVLAALSITDELFRAREETRAARDDARRRALEVAASLEEAVVAAYGEGDVGGNDGDGDEGEDVDGDG